MKELIQVAELPSASGFLLPNKPLIPSSLDALTTVKEFFEEETLHLQEQFVVICSNFKEMEKSNSFV